MKRFVAVVAVVVLSGVPALLRAESVDAQVTRLAKQSHEKYKAGDFAAAADLLFQAYELKPDPVLLFNVAKTYEKANNLDQAIRFYQRYLDQEGADPKMMRQANRALEKLQALDKEQKQQEADRKAKEDADRKAQADALAEQQRQLAEQQKKQEEQAKALEVARQQPPPPPPERPSKVPGAVLLGVGVVAAGAGAYLGITAMNDVNQEQPLHGDITTKNNLVSAAQHRAHLADACFGVGVVAGTVGIALLVRAIRAPSAEPAAAGASPAPAAGPSAMILPHGAMVGWGGTL